MVSKTSPFKAGIRKRINTSAVRCWVWVGWFASEYPYGFPECFGCDARCLERRFECCLRFAVLFPDGLDVGCGRRECAGAPPGCVPPLRSLRECFQCLRVLWGCELECCAHLW